MPLPIRRILPSIIREGEGPPEVETGASAPADEIMFVYVRPTEESDILISVPADQITTTTPAP